MFIIVPALIQWGFFAGCSAVRICMELGQKAWSNAFRLGVSGGGVQDQGWLLPLAKRWARVWRMFCARSSLCGHSRSRWATESIVPEQCGQAGEVSRLGWNL